MTTISNFQFSDLFNFNSVNVDRLTETYSLSFYGTYINQWPEYQRVAFHGPTGVMMGYMLGKAEGSGDDWHGHISAVTVAPPFRRTGLARGLMDSLEEISATLHNAYFVDLFVRKSNVIAKMMYEKLGYIIYQTVTGYYHGSKSHPSEDALDMRKAMPRNATRASGSSVIPTGRAINPEDVKWQ